MKISLRKFAGFLLASSLCVFLGCGCAERDETRHPLFLKGRKARNEGDGAAAAECFRSLLARRPGAVRSHLELAGVYDELLDDPLLAAAHYRIYLELVPDAADRDAIRMWQEAAEKRFCDRKNAAAPSVPPETPGTPGTTPAENPDAAAAPVPGDGAPGRAAAGATAADDRETVLAELRAENERLRAYLDDCKKQLASLGAENRKLRSAASAPAGAARPPQSENTLPAAAASTRTPPETYVVAPGDTLSGISRKVYGNSRFYPEILRANPGVGERSLRPGKVLRIPPRPDAAPKTEPSTKEVK